MGITRREMLKTSAVVAGGVLLSSCNAPDKCGGGLYGPFKMGLQTYSVRKWTDPADVCRKLNELGLDYAEFFESQMPMTTDPAKIKRYKDILAQHKINCWAYWGGLFKPKEDECRRKFEFAKAMGVKVLTGDPNPESFPILAKLTKEYGIRIAAHNHGPEARWYKTIEDMKKHLDDQPIEIGASVDTGHFIRSDVDPVKAILTLGPRVHSVHLKDAAGPNDHRRIGKGKLDVLGALKAIMEIGFQDCLALEYEEEKDNPIPGIQECLATIRANVKKM